MPFPHRNVNHPGNGNRHFLRRNFKILHGSPYIRITRRAIHSRLTQTVTIPEKYRDCQARLQAQTGIRPAPYGDKKNIPGNAVCVKYPETAFPAAGTVTCF